MNINYKLIGKRIRYYRKKMNISQMELSERTELSVPYISYVETGKKNVSVSTLINIAAALSVTPNHLLADYISCQDNVVSTEVSLILKDCTAREQNFFMDLILFVKDNRFFKE